MKKYVVLLLLASACNSGKTVTKTRIEEPASHIVEYTPAPGQFINSPQAGFDTPVTTPAEAVAYAERRLAMGGDPTPDGPADDPVDYGYISLGGWGGYIVARFDTPVPNTGDYDLYVTGNSFGGSSEPGIVWVARDTDGDGSHAGETWYELRGAEYDTRGGDITQSTTRDYEVTYVDPADAASAIAWSDNHDNHGTIDRIALHTQASYVPAWVSSLTYRGTRLRDNVELKQNRYDMFSFAWGYADNTSSIDGAGVKNRFKIANAVDAEGHPANLTQIDFVKVQTGVNCKAGNDVGEVSTDVCGIGCYRTVTKTE